MAIGNFGQCGGCGCRILWIRTKAGKNMPCNPTMLNYRKEAPYCWLPLREALPRQQLLPEVTVYSSMFFSDQFQDVPARPRPGIALEQCTDRYGTKIGEATEADCMEVVSAFLKQDHREESEE